MVLIVIPDFILCKFETSKVLDFSLKLLKCRILRTLNVFFFLYKLVIIQKIILSSLLFIQFLIVPRLKQVF